MDLSLKYYKRQGLLMDELSPGPGSLKLSATYALPLAVSIFAQPPSPVPYPAKMATKLQRVMVQPIVSSCLGAPSMRRAGRLIALFFLRTRSRPPLFSGTPISLRNTLETGISYFGRRTLSSGCSKTCVPGDADALNGPR